MYREDFVNDDFEWESEIESEMEIQDIAHDTTQVTPPEFRTYIDCNYIYRVSFLRHVQEAPYHTLH